MRPIDADAVYKIIESYEIRKDTIGNPLTDWEYGYTCGIERAESEIECAPTIDAEPVRHGKWIDGKAKHIKNGEIRHIRQCSECGSGYFVYDVYNSADEIPNYCPNCGADMRGDNSEHE